MSSASISISDAFDGGNIEHVKTDDANSKVLLRVKPDPFSELEKVNHLQYFSFRARVPAASSVEYVIENAGKCSYSSAWSGYTVFYSNDRKKWRRLVDTAYDKEEGHLKWSFEHEGSGSIHFCYFPPFSYERHLDLIAKCEASLVPTCSVRSLGQTLDGREMECVTVGTGSRTAWVIHRQHPGENMAEFFAEGLLTRLLGLDSDGSVDGLVKKALELYTFHIVPNMNPGMSFWCAGLILSNRVDFMFRIRANDKCLGYYICFIFRRCPSWASSNQCMWC